MTKVKEYVLFFFSIWGIVLTVYLGYMAFSPYIRNLIISPIELAHTYVIAALIMISRFVYHSDWATLKIAHKVRFWIGLIPAAFALGILSYDIGLQNWLFAFYEGNSQDSATVIFAVLYALSFIILLVIWFCVDRKLQLQTNKYNVALEAYKKKYRYTEVSQ